jgi:hypothetical protein
MMDQLRPERSSASASSAGQSFEGERRVARRQRAAAGSLSCQVCAGSDQTPMPAKIRDFSLGGIGFISRKQLDQGSALLVHVKNSKSFSRSLRAQVKHTTRLDDGSWLIGCALVDTLSKSELADLG